MSDSSDPFAGAQVVEALAALAATNVLQIQRAMGEEIVALVQAGLGRARLRRRVLARSGETC